VARAASTLRPAPGDPGSSGTGRFDWAFVRRVALDHRRRLTVAQLVAVLATASNLPLPLLFPALVDEVLLDQPGPAVATLRTVLPTGWQRPEVYILAILVVTLALRLINLVLNVVQAQQFTTISKDVTFRLRRALLNRLGDISIAEYESLGSGAVASNFVSDVNTVDEFVGSTVSRFTVAVLTLTGIAGVLLWIHWQLALFILVLNPLVIYFTTVLGRRVKDLKRRENSAVEVFQGALTETLDAIHQIRAANRERHFLDRLAASARELRDRSSAYAWKSYAAGRFSFVVFMFGFDVFRAAAMLLVLFSGLTVGQMFAVYSYLWYLMGPVQELLAMQYSYHAASGALARLNRLRELDEEPRYPRLENPFAGRGTVGVTVQGLAFSYRAGDEVLRGIDLEVAPGEKLGLVGASGGGKSTLINALLGLYPAVGGTIAYGGVPVTRIGWDVVREHVVAVLQHPALLNDTVRANLTFGSDRDDDELWRALGIAQLVDDVAALPAGLETPIGRQGDRLSGGQRQRLAIARLVLSKPRVVILDEATSALDLETEARLHAELLGHFSDRTVLIVAHRLSALRLVDRVVVFEHGQVAEEGDHEALLAQGGLYAALYGKLRR
jgi:ATP-binding cassette subfamily C protein